MNTDYEYNKQIKISIIFFILFILTIILISTLFGIKKSDKKAPNINTKKVNYAIRGSIFSANRYFLSTSKPLYSATIQKKYLDLDKKDTFIELFSKYSGISKVEIEEKLLQSSNYVELSRTINATTAKFLQELKYDLNRLKIFRPLVRGGITIGLDIHQFKEDRLYPLNTTLSPYLGYVRYDKHGKPYGDYGLELYYENLLQNSSDKILTGQRDKNGIIIRDKKNKSIKKENGFDIVTNINLTLQKKLESILTTQNERIKSKEIVAAIMESSTGKIIAVSSSKVYNPKKFSSIAKTKISAIRYIYEPGSVIKPIFFAMLLEAKKVRLDEKINTHNGRYLLRPGKIVKDEHRYPFLSASDVIVHSSNIGMIELSKRADTLNILDHLKKFGFATHSGIDLSYELSGTIPNMKEADHTIDRAVLFYGYGIRANFFQLLKAYNIFNNDGKIITPRIASIKITKDGKEESIVAIKPHKVLSQTNAKIMNQILQSVVIRGTGKKTKTNGLSIGGKTGTSEFYRRINGVKIKGYNSSFFGFANDKNSKYTIGVTVIEPNPVGYIHFASQSAVPTFKEIVDTMVELELLKPTN